MLYPSLCLRTIEILCCLLSTWYQLENQFCKREVELAEIALFCNPMVHLDIDIGVVVTVPRRIERIGPKSLKIWRKTSGTGA